MHPTPIRSSSNFLVDVILTVSDERPSIPVAYHPLPEIDATGEAHCDRPAIAVAVLRLAGD
jgi:hypothetical protein